MKIRTGFVSNSSSTSFCIYGTRIQTPEKWSDFSEMLREVGLSYEWPIEDRWPEDAGVYIGIRPEDIRDDETGAEFKARVQQSIQEIQGMYITLEGDLECCWVTQGGYDG